MGGVRGCGGVTKRGEKISGREPVIGEANPKGGPHLGCAQAIDGAGACEGLWIRRWRRPKIGCAPPLRIAHSPAIVVTSPRLLLRHCLCHLTSLPSPPRKHHAYHSVNKCRSPRLAEEEEEEGRGRFGSSAAVIMATAAAARSLVAAAPCVGASRDSRFLGAKVASFAPLVSHRGSSLVVRAGSGLPSPTKVRSLYFTWSCVVYLAPRVSCDVLALHCAKKRPETPSPCL